MLRDRLIITDTIHMILLRCLYMLMKIISLTIKQIRLEL
uniref:Uncharacterized protein n=1 Tax=virus sp. ctx9V1 TaxID=2828001 RepID=A0A8S5RDM9_9VIRU|nr:MAG TPA: hypothetical protein [virus sp. ctx9V1]